MDPSLPRVSVTELRRHFARVLRDVEQGRIVVITRRGRDVALLLPSEPRDHRHDQSPSPDE